MKIIFLSIGVFSLLVGMLLTFSDRFNKRMETVRHRHESAADRHLFTRKAGYFVSRYVAGAAFLAVGVILVILGTAS